MADLLVRRCSVHTVLPRPWGWPSRDRLVEATVRHVTGIILAELASALNMSATRGSVPQLSVHVRIPASAIVAGGGGSLAASVSSEIVRAARVALEASPWHAVVPLHAAAAPELPIETPLDASGELTGTDPRAQDEEVGGDVGPADDPRRDHARVVAMFLHRLAKDGRLQAMLSTATADQLRRWEFLLRQYAARDWSGTSPAETSEVQGLLPILNAEESLEWTQVLRDTSDPVAARLFAVIALAHRARRTMPTADLWAAADITPAGEVDAVSSGTGGDHGVLSASEVAVSENLWPGRRSSRGGMEEPPQPSPSRGVESARHPAEGHQAPRRPWSPPAEVAVPSALPFLLLGPLDDVGVLAAVEAALLGAGLEAEVDAYATALAYKVLGTPALGWLREPADVNAAAAYAGRAAPVGGERLEQLAGTAEQWSQVVDTVIREELVRGHVPDTPLVVVAGRDGLIVADADGLFPMLWGASGEDLLRLRVDLGQPRLIETTQSNEVRLLAAIVDVLDRRPGVAHSASPRLEQHLNLCASLALATLAWNLWPEEDERSALHTLDRLGDIDAVVRFTPDAVSVVLPLGLRTSHLAEAGLLRTVAGVPWFEGRVVEFATG